MTQEMRATGTTQDIAGFITQCQFPADAFLLVEQMPQHVVSDDERQDLLCFALLGDNLDVTPYTSGRVFSRAFELRWERDAETTRVVYLGARRELPALQEPQQETFEPVGEKRYYLFGTRLDQDDLDTMGIEPDGKDYPYYAEVRIPRLLRYPIAAQARRAQLVVGEYQRQDRKGERLFRFLDLIPAKEEGEHA
jgi:hypothetical protein